MFVTSQDVINFFFEFIRVYNLLFITSEFFSLTEKFCQIVYIKVFNDHSQLKQCSQVFSLLISFFRQNWLLIQIQPSGGVLLRGCPVSAMNLWGSTDVEV